MTAYAIDRFRFRFKRLVIGAVPVRHAGPGRHHPGRHLPGRQRPRPVQHPVGADRALHRAPTSSRSTSSCSSSAASRCPWTRPPASTAPAAFRIYRRIIFPLLKPAIATVVIIKGITVYNDFYIPFLYMPSQDLGVISTSLFRFKGPFGAHWEVDLGRRGPRHRADAGRVPVAATLHLQRLHHGCGQVKEHARMSTYQPAARRLDRDRRGRTTDGHRRTPSPACPATVPGLRAHRPARRRPDRRPVPRRQRARQSPGSAAPTGCTRPRSAGPRRRAGPGRAGLRRAGHGRHASSVNGIERAHRRTCTAATASTSRALLRAGDNTLAVRFDRAVPLRRGAPRRARRRGPDAYTEPYHVHPQDGLQLRLGLGPDPGHRRASGSRSACIPGRPPGSPRSGRWPPSTDGRAVVEVHVDVERAGDGPVHGRRRVAGVDRRAAADRPGATAASLVLEVAGRRAVVAARATATSPCTTA